MSVLGRIRCWLGYHDWHYIHRFSRTTGKIGCHRCNRMWGIHHGERALLPWDDELEDLMRFLYAEQFTSNSDL